MIKFIKAIVGSVGQWRDGNSETPFRLVGAIRVDLRKKS